MNADALLSGQYLKAAEFDGTILPTSPTWTIARIEIEELPDLKKPDATKRKGVIYFRDVERGWVMNRTNVECLKALFGADTAGWIGKRVTLCTEPTRTGDGIRVHGSPDIERDVTATWKVPKKAAQTKRMVPTGRKPDAAPQRQPANAPADPLAGFRAHLARLTLTPDDVIAWLASMGVDAAALTSDDRRGWVAELTDPAGRARTDYAAWLASRPSDTL